MKTLCFSDVHLGAHGRRDDQEAVLARIADLAIAEAVDCCLFAGDMFEGPGVPSSDYVRVRRALVDPLGAAGIPIIGISGNSRHDSASAQGEENAMAVLDDDSFHVFTRPGLAPYGYVTIACVPWASTSRLRALLGQADDTDALAAELVIRIMAGLHAEAERDYPGVPCICISHFATTGWKTPTGLPTDDIRDVLLPLGELEALGFDAILLGHVHAPGVINEDSTGGRASSQSAERGLARLHADGGPVAQAPGLAARSQGPIISLGSPGCLNHGEATVEHGVWIVEDGVPEFRPVEHRAFLTLDYDLVNTVVQDAPVEELAEHAAVIVSRVPTAGTDLAPVFRIRLNVTAEQDRRIDRQALKAAVLAAGAHEVTVEATVERTTRARVEGMTEAVAPMDALDRWLSEQGVNGLVGDGVRAWTRTAIEALA